MADAPISYQIVIATFVFLTGLLFAVRRKYYRTRLSKKSAATKTKIDWMRTSK